MTILTYRNAPVLHPNEVVTYKPNTPLSIAGEIPTQTTELAGRSLGQPFTFSPGDHLLLCVSGILGGSASRFGTSWTATSQFYTGSPGELAFAPHGAGFSTGEFTGDNGLTSLTGYGFGFKAFFMYIDRENGLGRITLVVQDSVAPYLDAFDGIRDMTRGANWNDASIGEVQIDLGFNSKWAEHGTVRAIKWEEGKAPPIAMVETAMEFMWYEWVMRNNTVIYPALLGF